MVRSCTQDYAAIATAKRGLGLSRDLPWGERVETPKKEPVVDAMGDACEYCRDLGDCQGWCFHARF